MRFPLDILAIIWAILLVVDLVGRLPPSVTTWTLLAEGVIWLIFAIDFVVELLIAPDRVRFIRTHPLLLLSLVIPFARIFAVASFLFLLRPTLLIRTLMVINRASRSARELLREYQLGYVAALVLLVEFVGAAAILFFERDEPGTGFTSYGNALWWTANMLTTVNAGPEPVTTEGRILALLLRVFAVILVAYVTGSVTSYLVTRKNNRRPILRSVDELDAELDRFRSVLERFELDLQQQEYQQPSEEEEE
ncbi:MAG TPA: ion transporter [Chloroflexota bacterium]|nr:ion transporter [Chloroflexota bacterium]